MRDPQSRPALSGSGPGLPMEEARRHDPYGGGAEVRVKSQVTVGIDLGTSNSCVAALIDGEPRVLSNAQGEPTTPSVVGFAEGGKISVGTAAKRGVILDPKHTVASAKRLIGRYIFSEEVQKAKAVCRYEIVDDGQRGVRIKIREEMFSLPEISAFILAEIKRVAEGQIGCPVTK